MGIHQNVVKGKRLTDKYTLNVVLMTYAGLINKKIVSILQKLGCNVLGMSGADVDIIKSVKTLHHYGYVGQDICINRTNLSFFITILIPIFCSITHNGNGELFNNNADSVSSVIAIYLNCDNNTVILQSIFENQGVLNFKNNYYLSLIINNINNTSYINKGMIPKIDNALNALKNEVKIVTIGHYKYLLYLNNKTYIWSGSSVG
jgi:acetylglutamate kinase